MDASWGAGQAIFGTRKGLQAVGDGVLSAAPRALELFELREGGLLPMEGGEIGFRKAIMDSSGGQWDLLALAFGAHDDFGRAGFLGVAVAVPYGRIDLYQQAFSSIASHVLVLRDGGWDKVASGLTVGKSDSKGDNRNSTLWELDRDSPMVALRRSEEVQGRFESLCYLGCSQVASLDRFRNSLVYVAEEGDSKADALNIQFLEACRKEREAELENALEQLRAEYEDEIERARQSGSAELQATNNALADKDRELSEVFAEKNQLHDELQSARAEVSKLRTRPAAVGGSTHLGRGWGSEVSRPVNRPPRRSEEILEDGGSRKFLRIWPRSRKRRGGGKKKSRGHLGFRSDSVFWKARYWLLLILLGVAFGVAGFLLLKAVVEIFVSLLSRLWFF